MNGSLQDQLQAILQTGTPENITQNINSLGLGTQQPASVGNLGGFDPSAIA